MTDVDDHRDWRDDGYEPDPADYLEQKAQEEHEDEAHGGKPCNCPVPTAEEIAAQWAERDRKHREDEHGGGPCTCDIEPPF